MYNLQITQPATIKAYFEKVLLLKGSGEKFPIDLDDVWALVYSRKDHAVAALRDSFFEGEDFNLLQNREVIHSSEIRNGIAVTYKLSVPCLEYFIARKVREVFNVYREVFHKAVETAKELSRMDILQLAMEAEREKEALRLEVGELAPKAAFYDIAMSSNTAILMRDCAKVLSDRGKVIGEHKLYAFLREAAILMPNNQPYQMYVDRHYFKVKLNNYTDSKGEVHTTTTTLVLPKGLDYIHKLLSMPNNGAS